MALITYDEDLSDEKLTLLGGQRHIFYLRDDGRRLENARRHIGLKDYVRPMSQFIRDLKQEQDIDSPSAASSPVLSCLSNEATVI